MVANSEPQGIHRRIKIVATPSLIERLNAKVQRGDASQCWPWLGAQRNGYGAIKHEGKVLGSHVVAFIVANGEISEGHIITHDCDNRLCCNPSHLKAGTPSSNSREAWDRRQVNATRGTKHPGAKLTDDIVRQIRLLRHKEGLTYPKIAEQLGLNVETVKKVGFGKIWKHVVDNA